MAETPNPLDDPKKRAAQKAAHQVKQNVPVDLDRLIAGLNVLTGETQNLREDIVGEDGLQAQIKKLDRGRLSNRRLIWLTLAGLLADFGLSGAVIYLYGRVNHNSSALVVNCRASKQFAEMFRPQIEDIVAHPEHAPDAASLRSARMLAEMLDRKC